LIGPLACASVRRELPFGKDPIYPVPVLSFFEGSSAFRLDDTLEVLRGGPSTIYSVGQPGATMNFILKNNLARAARSKDWSLKQELISMSI
jgi:hypothetical protein